MRSLDNGMIYLKKGSFDAVLAMSKGPFTYDIHKFSYKGRNSQLRTILFSCDIMFAFYLTLKNGAVTLIVLLQRSGEIITPGAFRTYGMSATDVFSCCPRTLRICPLRRLKSDMRSASAQNQSVCGTPRRNETCQL